MTQANAVISVGLDPASLATAQAVCDALNVTLHQASIDEATGEAGLALCAIEQFDALHALRPELATIVIASATDSQQTIEAMKRGAIECLLMPLHEPTLREQISEALIAGEAPSPRQPMRSMVAGAEDGIIGQSPAMAAVYKLVGLIAPRQVNVLITGESGTGKEVIAKALHRHSDRVDEALLAVNCAAIPETLLESELFGHEQGAFTGADRRKIGKFEQAHGGTLFLDEIGDMPLATQVKLLRVLQDQKFQRLGGAQTVQADVRIIAATHQPLEQLIADKTFRQDLYYRLKVATIHLPPLRQREVDAVLLAHYFVEQLNPQFGTHITSFSPEAVKLLLSYDWPGNVRELENVIKASLLVARGPVFRAEFLPESIRRPIQTTDRAARDETGDGDLQTLVQHYLSDAGSVGHVHRAVSEHVDRVLLTAALNHTGGHLQRTADLLGISRTTLRQRMRHLGITIESSAKASP